MSTITIEEAQAQLAALIDNLRAGEEIVITRNHKPIAKLTGEGQPERPPRQPGTLKGTVLYMAADFDAPLEDFEEYMP
jgi:prevent-host-death family protein